MGHFGTNFNIERHTLKPLIFATLIFATLIFANEGKNSKVFCDINFCDCLVLKDFATLIFANAQIWKLYNLFLSINLALKRSSIMDKFMPVSCIPLFQIYYLSSLFTLSYIRIDKSNFKTKSIFENIFFHFENFLRH